MQGNYNRPFILPPEIARMGQEHRHKKELKVSRKQWSRENRDHKYVTIAKRTF